MEVRWIGLRGVASKPTLACDGREVPGDSKTLIWIARKDQPPAVIRFGCPFTDPPSEMDR